MFTLSDQGIFPPSYSYLLWQPILHFSGFLDDIFFFADVFGWVSLLGSFPPRGYPGMVSSHTVALSSLICGFSLSHCHPAGGWGSERASVFWMVRETSLRLSQWPRATYMAVPRFQRAEQALDCIWREEMGWVSRTDHNLCHSSKVRSVQRWIWALIMVGLTTRSMLFSLRCVVLQGKGGTSKKD